jgi:hypothetical protein
MRRSTANSVRTCLAATAALIVICHGTTAGQELKKPIPTAAQLSESILIYGKKSGGILQATGVIVDSERKWAVTTWHFWSSVEQPGVLAPIWNDSRLVTAPSPYLNIYLENKAAQPRLVWSDPTCDLALIEIPGLHSSSAVRISRVANADGDPLLILGNPTARNAMWEMSRGAMGASKWAEWTYESGQRVCARMLEFETPEPLSTGFSGGPVFTANGELAGIIVAAAKPDGTSAYAVDALTITRFLARAHGRLALQRNAENDLQLAKRLSNLAIASDADDPWGYVVRGQVLLKQERPSEAIDDFRSALRLSVFGRSYASCNLFSRTLKVGCVKLGSNEPRVAADK